MATVNGVHFAVRATAIAGVVALTLTIGLGVAVPSQALASLCTATEVPGDVIFIRKVAEAPPQGGPFQDVVGVYVLRGSTGSGNPLGGGSRTPQR